MVPPAKTSFAVALAAAALLATSATPAAVVSVPTPADLAPTALPLADPGINVLWDVNGDSIADFNFSFRQPQAGGGLDWQASVFPLNSSGVIATGSAGDFFATRLGAGATIGSSSTFLGAPGQGILRENFNGTGAGDFAGANANGFIGFSFMVGANTFYGWLNLTVTRSSGGGITGIDFISAAYDNTPGTAITTIPEPGTLVLAAVAGFAGLAVARRRRVH